MNNIEKLEMIQKGVYMICLALVSITEMECCTYGFDDVVKMAENYIKAKALRSGISKPITSALRRTMRAIPMWTPPAAA